MWTVSRGGPADETTGDDDVEHESDWLSVVLLVPEDAVLAVARGWKTEPEAADHFGVSPQLLSWRINMTEARRRVERTRALTGRRRP